MNLIVQGQPNKVIAKQLNMSIRTVESRRHEVFTKMGVESVAELVRLAIEGELVVRPVGLPTFFPRHVPFSPHAVAVGFLQSTKGHSRISGGEQPRVLCPTITAPSSRACGDPQKPAPIATLRPARPALDGSGGGTAANGERT